MQGWGGVGGEREDRQPSIGGNLPTHGSIQSWVCREACPTPRPCLRLPHLQAWLPGFRVAPTNLDFRLGSGPLTFSPPASPNRDLCLQPQAGPFTLTLSQDS